MPLHRTRGSWLALVLSVLVSLYVPLAIGAKVPPGLLRARDFAWPVGVTLAISGTTFGLAWLIRRSAEKAALAAVLVVAAFSSLGWVVRSLEFTGADRAVGGLIGVVTMYLVALLSMLVALLAARRSLALPVALLTRMVVLLVAWNAALIAWRGRRAGQDPGPPVPDSISAPLSLADTAPDIYLIVLDKYTGSEALRSEFDFDNRAIEAALRARGFVVPAHAQTNYVHTFLSLAATLNLRYLDDLTERFGSDSRWELAYPMIENSRLVTFLRARGYRFVFFPSDFWGTRQNRFADLQLPDPRDVRSELTDRWTRVTAGPVLRATVGCRYAGCDSQLWPYTPGSATLMD